MKNSVKYIIIVICILSSIYFLEDIVAFFKAPMKKEAEKQEIIIPTINEYKIFAEQYAYVQDTNKFVPSDKQDILNIVYTVLNSGWDTFTFYCPKGYETCIDDVTDITNNNETLSNINNYVHPFNSFKTIETNYTTSGEITLIVHKLYSNEQIEELNKKVDEIYNELITSDMSDVDKITKIHDYIINNTKYDDAKISGVLKDNSNNAYGVLFDGYGVCSGYTDAMALFLNKMNIQNIKVSSNNHIWNLIYINNKWSNIDLTFDDPVTDTNEDILSHDYFLIDSTTMIEIDKSSQHNFNRDIFVEAVN